MSRSQFAARERGTQPAFFYLDLNDTVRRAALLTAVVRNKMPTVESLKRDYARALAQLNDAPLNTAGSHGLLPAALFCGSQEQEPWSTNRYCHRATAPNRGLLRYDTYNMVCSS